MFKDLFIVQVFTKGGLLMWPILACSVLTLTVVLERYRFFRRIALDSETFMRRIKGALAIRDYADALRACRSERHPVAHVIAVAIDHLNLDRNHLQELMRQEAIRQRRRLERQLSLLSTITAIAPLLGLTGTVTGLIQAFNVLGSLGGVSDPTALAGGIAEALYTTAAGMLVGIPTLIAFNWCEAQVEHHENEVQHRSLEFLNYVELAGVDVHVARAA